MHRFGHLLAALVVWGCGARDRQPSPPADDDDTVVPDLPEPPTCPPGTLELPDASCRPAGIAPGECGEGFVHDGDVGCEPVLPEQACGPGTMAIPGETACRQVAPCGQGTWGDIPVEPDTQHVDAAYGGTDSDGSAAKPWPTVQAGIDAAAPGAIVAIAAGSYVEHLLIEGKPVRLWGKCPRDVEIVGPDVSSFVIDLRGGAAGTEVRDLAITGSGFGFAVAGSQKVVGDRLWIHDTTLPGVSVQNFGGTTSATLRRSLIESVVDIGVYGLGAGVTVEESVVRSTKRVAEGFGRGMSIAGDTVSMTEGHLTVRRSLVVDNAELGIYVSGSTGMIRDSVIGHTPDPMAADPMAGGPTAGDGVAVRRQIDTGIPATVTIERSVVEQTFGFGIYAQDSSLTMDATVIRDVAPNSDGLGGMALRAGTELAELGVTTTIRNSLVERAHSCGVCVGGTTTLVESVVVRDIDRQPADGNLGRGMSIEGNTFGDAPIMGDGVIRGSAIERVHEVGLAAVFADALVESTVARDVEPRQSGEFGRGMSAELDLVTGLGAVVAFDNVLVERSHEFGLFVGGSEATIARSQVRDVFARPSDGIGGVGIAIQMSFEKGTGATATITDTVVERTQQSGLSVIGASAAFDGVHVSDSLPDGDGAFGDGLVASAAIYSDAVVPAPTTITASRIEASTRAGVLAFATDITLADSIFECNAIHLNGETYEDLGFSIVDDGGNSCGCAGTATTCKVLSSNLEVPAPIP